VTKHRSTTETVAELRRQDICNLKPPARLGAFRPRKRK
jgi:hypothetical protein